MADVKLDAKVLAKVAEALEEHTTTMFDRLGSRWVAVVELQAVERSEPADDEKPDTVKLRITELELATGENARHVRDVLAALYRLRTTAGTLDEDSSAARILRTASGVLLTSLDGGR
ncbi:hypothetical protein [Nonomuraea dietziae]|uniref:hypothetical protein n=1 Tax=Nonomuraea dietziae TaxID=65515 RepID=UPI00342AB4E2